MDRKHFLRLSGASLAGLIFSSAIAERQQEHQVVLPDEVWIQSQDKWYQLKASSGTKYTYKDVEVLLKHQQGLLSVFVNSPVDPLSAVRLKWKYKIASDAKCLGDHWERTYGDVSWQQPKADKKMPWYFIESNDKSANCFGVKTGAGSICYWNVYESNVQ